MGERGWRGLRLDREGIGFGGTIVGAFVGIVSVPEAQRSFVWAGLAFGLGLFGGIGFMRYRLGKRAPHAEAADRLVRSLHKRWFPGPKAHLDPHYRVALFLPFPSSTDPQEWRCVARTGDISKRCWKHPTSSTDLRYSGVVAYTAYEQVPVNAPGVPETNRTPAELERYRGDTYVDDRTHDGLSWPHATMRSLFARGPRGTIICVVTVERKSGEPISVTSTRPSEDACAVELQLAAEVWATAWEDS